VNALTTNVIALSLICGKGVYGYVGNHISEFSKWRIPSGSSIIYGIYGI